MRFGGVNLVMRSRIRKMLWAVGPLSRVSSLMTASRQEAHVEARTKPQTALLNNPSPVDVQWDIQTVQTGHQQTDLIPNPVLMDAKAFRENSNTTNVKLRRAPKVCVMRAQQGLISVQSSQCLAERG